MTPEERAKYLSKLLGFDPDRTSEIEVYILEQIREAIAAETERCARIADNFAGAHGTCRGIALAIRARSKAG